MDLPKAFMVLMALVVTTLSMPLSTPDSTQLFCFASDIPAPSADLYAIINDFCANTFPRAYIPNPIILGRTFDLASGGTAEIEVNLDAAVARLTAGDCHLNLAKTVADCESNGKSTGGVYSPIRTGDSKFKVQVNLPRGANSPAEVASPDDCEDDNSTSTISKRDGPYCWVKGGSSDKPTVPMMWASQAVADWCTWMDGKILYDGQEFDNLVNWVVPSIFVSIQAFRTVSVFKDGCERSFESLLRTCSDQDWNFSGGYFRDALAEYSIDIRDPVEASSKSVASTADDSKVAARSAIKEATDVFNATESTNGLFTTACDGPALSGTVMSVDSVKAQGAANYMCLTFNGKAIEKGDQIPATFEDPAQFANIIALDTFTVTTADCDWAYDTLFKACSSGDRFYGGTVTFGPATYVLEIPPGGLDSAPAISARDLPAPNSTHTNATEDDAKNECFYTQGYSANSYRALLVGADVCEQLNGKDMDKGDWQSYTLYADEDDPTIKATVQAYLGTGEPLTQCFNTFEYLIEECEIEKIFFGGRKSSEGITVTLDILTKAPDSKAIDSSSQDSSALAARSSDDGVCQENGITVDRFHALTAAWDTCDRVGTHDWNVNDGMTHLYTDDLPWISSRIVATQPMSIEFGKCMVALSALIESCTSDSIFCGGTIESEGAKYTLIAVPDTKTVGKAIDTSTDAALHRRSDSAEPVITGLICDPLGEYWVEWDQAFNAGIQLCSSLDNVPLTAGFDYLNVYQEGLTWVYAQLTSPYVGTSIDYTSCAKIFLTATQACRRQIGDHTSGGAVHSGNVTMKYWVGDVNTTAPTLQARSTDETTTTSSVVRRRNDPYHNSNIQCHYDDGLSVRWDLAFSATIEFCDSISGAALNAGMQNINTYQRGMYWVWTQFTPLLEMRLDYQTCIELFDATIRACRNGDQTSGGLITFGDYVADYDVHLNTTTAKDSTEAADTSSVAPRQNNDCIRAESTPVNKHVPCGAIGIFCKQYEGHFLAANQGVNATWSNSGVDTSLYVTATAAEGYTLDLKRCLSGFERLMTDCGDGEADTTTNGGTLVGIGASFSLILVSI